MNNRDQLLAITIVIVSLAGCTSTSGGINNITDLNALSDQLSANGTASSTTPTEVSSSALQQTPPAESTLRVMATTDDELTYRFTVDGSVTKTRAADGTAADADDQVIDNGDGTMTVVGSTGDQSGDAYVVNGEISAFRKTGGASLYRLFLDDEEVTEDLTPGSTFEIISTDDNSELAFEFTVAGEVQRMLSEDGHAGDQSDEIVENGDGTVTVRGSTGFGSGDAFAVNGEIMSFEKTGGESGFALYLDGEDVTGELPPPDGGGGGGNGGPSPPDQCDEVVADQQYTEANIISCEATVEANTIVVSGTAYNPHDEEVNDQIAVAQIVDEYGEVIARAHGGVGGAAIAPGETASFRIVFDRSALRSDKIPGLKPGVVANRMAGFDIGLTASAPGPPENWDDEYRDVFGERGTNAEIDAIANVPASGRGSTGEGTLVYGEVDNPNSFDDANRVEVTVSLYDQNDNLLATKTVDVGALASSEKTTWAMWFPDVRDDQVVTMEYDGVGYRE